MKVTQEDYGRYERDYARRLDWIVARLHNGSPLNAVPRDKLRMLVDDALQAAGFDDLLMLAEVNRRKAIQAGEAAASWKARAARANDQDVCEHCGASSEEQELTRSAVSCTPCLAKLFTRK